MTKYEATVISAYTGIAMTSFGNIHEYAEKKLGRPIFTHEFADETVWKVLNEKCKGDFLEICRAVENTNDPV